MALTQAQLGNSIYLTNMIKNLQRQREEALRQNDVTKNMNLRLLRQTNALNGLNGGIEESSYARLLSGANKGAADINAQFMPQIAEYKAYLSALNAAPRRGGGGGGGRSKKDEEDKDTNIINKPGYGRGNGRGYGGYGAPQSPLLPARNKNWDMVK